MPMLECTSAWVQHVRVPLAASGPVESRVGGWRSFEVHSSGFTNFASGRRQTHRQLSDTLAQLGHKLVQGSGGVVDFLYNSN